MRDHSQHIELTRDDAVAAMLASLEVAGFRDNALRQREQVTLGESFGRVLAEDIFAKTDLPNCLTCRMDSVALRWDDFAGLAEDEIPDTSNWTRGVEWQFANTGIAMPEGFDTAIVIEKVEVSDDEQRIKLLGRPQERFAGTRAAGSTMAKGDLAIEAGCIITPDIAAAISSAGHSVVLVERRPAVSFLPTGNELVPANLPYSEKAPDFYAGRGHVFESNSILTRGNVEKWGGTFVPFDIVPDEYDTIKAAVLRAVAISDIVVLNAGSSKGSDDWSVEVLDEIGTMVCHQVSHGPAHHSFMALVDGTPVVGISGPPGGAAFSLQFYLRPLMNAWLGLDTAPRTAPALLKGSFGENKWAKKGGERNPKAQPAATRPAFHSIRFMQLELQPDGTLTATPTAGNDNSVKARISDAVFLLPSDSDSVFPVEGETIEVELR